MGSILILFHCESNPGFAASSHEHTFLAMALRLVKCYDKIHFAYRTLEGGITSNLPAELKNFIELDTRWSEPSKLKKLESYIKDNNIKIIFGFDQPPRRRAYKNLRRAGVKHFISYYGAPMSSINSGFKLLLKKTEIALSNNGPDHYIFQSEGMLRTATHGRGIPEKNTSLVRTGIDTDKYKPGQLGDKYAHNQFSIPQHKKIVIFSGHMEERKGVSIIIKAAVYLCEKLKRDDIHFLILGNKPGQKKKFDHLYKDTIAENSVTFGGYRNDVPELLRSCSAGIIASTGWDSFPMSSVEMAATELPLLISDLKGLKEAINEESGMLFPAGDYKAASEALVKLMDNSDLRKRMGTAGRKRSIKYYSKEQQVTALERIVRNIVKSKR